MKTTRRKFVQHAFKASVVSTIGTSFFSATLHAGHRAIVDVSNDRSSAVEFKQVPLPYAYNALEPHIDALTMEIHYTKHHTSYIKNVNDAIAAEKIAFSN